MNATQWRKWVRNTGHPSEEDAKSVWDFWTKNGGWVYVAKVGGRNDVWKVGKTGLTNPFERVFALESAVSATASFELVWAVLHVNRHDAETQVHKKMKRLRMHRGKEFFEGPLDTVKQCLKAYEEDEEEDWAGWDVAGWRSALPQAQWFGAPFDWDEWWRVQDKDSF